MRISGRIENFKNLKKIYFLTLREKGKLYDLVVKDPKLICLLNTKRLDSYLLVETEVGETELYLKKIIKSYSSETFCPFSFYDQKYTPTSFAVRMENRVHDLKSIENYQIFKFRSELLKWIREYFYLTNHLEITTPKIITVGAEGGSDLFEIRYFKKRAFLSQSPQLYKQMAINQGYSKVFEIGPIFRGERSDTNRHLSEATSVDFEMELSLTMDPLKELIDYNLSFLNYIFEKGSKYQNPEISENCKRLILELSEIKYRKDSEETVEGFCIVNEYKKKDKPFYIKNVKNENKGFDIEYNGLELTSGGQREENFEQLTKEIQLRSITINSLKEYLLTFRGGAPIQGGNAYGLERLMMVILKKENIREGILYYRDKTKITP
jgi:aspartyl/asparaginyl-tRNA synthetase